MIRNYKWIMLVTLLAMLISAPVASFAEKSGKFKVARTMYVAGTEIKAGTYDVKYDASGSQATVMFYDNGREVAKVQGKVEDGGRVSDYNSLGIGKDSAGRDAIKELMFRGEKTVIRFD